MAILCGTGDSGALTLYDIPDSDLAKFQLKTRPLSEADMRTLFPGKDKPSKEDAHGVIAVPASGGDVQGFSANDICWQYIDNYGDYIWWVC